MSEYKSIEKLEKFVEKFSFPRLSGTKGESKSVYLTLETFKSLGYNEEEIVLQPFKFSTFYSEIFTKIIIILNIISITLLLLIKYISPILLFLFGIILVIVFISMYKVLKHPELKGFWENRCGKILSSTNVFTKVSAASLPPDKAGNIIVSAHLDSKSQTYVTIWRVFFFELWIVGEIILIVLYPIFIFDYHEIIVIFIPIMYILELAIFIATVLVIFSNLCLLILKIGNRSLGSLDNATGMAIVFTLSSTFRNTPLKNYNIWFCQFSAEEIGTMGSRNFLDAYEKEFVEGKTFQINLDMISAKDEKNNRLEYVKSYGFFPRKKISPILSNLIEKAANIQNLKIKEKHFTTGAHTDSIPFHLRKFDVIDLITKSAANYAHSSKDTPDKVDFEVLLDTTNIIEKFINMLDDQ